MTDITNNSDLLEGKPRGSVVLKDLIDRINNMIQADLIDVADDIETQSSILTATGIWLDHIGNRLDCERPYTSISIGTWFGFDGNGLPFTQAPFIPASNSGTAPISDEAYRSLLIVKGAQLITDGSIPSMNAILEGAFGSGYYIDNGDMSLTVVITATELSNPTIKYIVDAGFVTKPAGVNLRQILIEHTTGQFGFEGNGLPFTQAPFIKTFSYI